jgi:TonB family protein
MLRTTTIIAFLACCLTVACTQNSADPQSQNRPTEDQPAPPQPIRVSSEVMLGLVEHKAMPIYPDEAMRKGIQGDVVFKVRLDETGKMVSRALVAGDPLLVTASVGALRNTRFRPYLFNGAAVSVESQLGFHFSMEKNAGGINGHVECITSIPDPPTS